MVAETQNSFRKTKRRCWVLEMWMFIYLTLKKTNKPEDQSVVWLARSFHGKGVSRNNANVC
jgi:hypothetical protein